MTWITVSHLKTLKNSACWKMFQTIRSALDTTKDLLIYIAPTYSWILKCSITKPSVTALLWCGDAIARSKFVRLLKIYQNFQCLPHLSSQNSLLLRKGFHYETFSVQRSPFFKKEERQFKVFCWPNNFSNDSLRPLFLDFSQRDPIIWSWDAVVVVCIIVIFFAFLYCTVKQRTIDFWSAWTCMVYLTIMCCFGSEPSWILQEGNNSSFYR